ncbi:Cytosolic phospholipase A2 zeta [Lobosporangium transversale]|uniref:C2 domain-containing protein n=1 Tax=Lobosporangium transversale TaxID=64571 RepID=A0A1Y2GTT3_9FUNG|nr:C2 domain-containing protein [Lobosporangium transversale]KAF9898518.1 Cytosolic phospholipase A2 zeta [Lobosporangium transversale]ORZ18214.1 C2 domain-containing protein [Lobosporangium transversale]|eukprot:XP_021882009.1 C2 domain-containing protein [Lobosporangium transversale]
MSQSLQVTIHQASQLDDVEAFGKNDPYARVTLDFERKELYQKTATKKNAGNDVEWNQTVVLSDYEPSQHHYLYVEVLDDETGADAPIGFAAIPLSQVRSAPNETLRAKYDLYTPSGKEKGTITLTIQALQPGEQASHSTHSGPEVKGQSQIVTEHHDKVKSQRNKERATDAAVAAGAAGVLGLAGALLGGLGGNAAPPS